MRIETSVRATLRKAELSGHISRAAQFISIGKAGRQAAVYTKYLLRYMTTSCMDSAPLARDDCRLISLLLLCVFLFRIGAGDKYLAKPVEFALLVWISSSPSRCFFISFRVVVSHIQWWSQKFQQLLR